MSGHDGAAPGIVARLDRYQRRHRWLGVPLAVLDKFVDDRGPLLAALITYNGFLSLFPLLLVLSTTLRLVLRDHPELADELFGSTLARFPVVGEEITATVHPLEGSAVALVIGGLLALYGGLGFTATVGHASTSMWGVPVDQRPHPLVARARGSLMLVLLGVGLGVTTALSALSAAPLGRVGAACRCGHAGRRVVVNAALFLVAFRALTVRELTFRQVAPGAIVAALAWQALELGAIRYATDAARRRRPAVRGVRAGAGAARVDLPGGAGGGDRRRGQRGARGPAVAQGAAHHHPLRRTGRPDRRRPALPRVVRPLQRYKSFERIEVAFSPPAEDRRPRPEAC